MSGLTITGITAPAMQQYIAPAENPSLLATVTNGLSSVGAVFAQIISFPSGANEEKTEPQECLSQDFHRIFEVTQGIFEVTQADVTKHDPNILATIYQLYEPFFQQCCEKEACNLRQEHANGTKYHEKEMQALEATLKKIVSGITAPALQQYVPPAENPSLLTTVTNCLSYVDAVFSRIVSFPPGANAEKQNELQTCFGKVMDVLVEGGEVAIRTNNVLLLKELRANYGEFSSGCFEEQSYNRQRELHVPALAHHEKELRILQTTLEKCRVENPGYRCYEDGNKHDRLPQMKPVQIINDRLKNEEETAPKFQWVTVPGFLCWKIWIDRPWKKDQQYAQGGYNCDHAANKPTETYEIV